MTDCYICKEIKETGRYYQIGTWVNISIEKDRWNDNIFKINAVGDGTVSMTCNYCPNCGRQLEKEVVD